MSVTRVRGRFAPTPSGRLHLGNALSALLAWLQIRAESGEMILRLEDLDRARCKPAYAAQLLEDMRWLGLDWEEGPDAGGPWAPYEQSLRSERYEEALGILKREGHLYECFCSRADLLSAASAPHGLASEGAGCAGECRRLTEAQKAERAAKKSPALRFAMPDRAFPFADGIAGTVVFPAGAGGDFVVRRADGVIGYQLAVVVDDIAMRVTDVLRGWDLLDSTPRQLALYEALGAAPPRFAHGPLLLGPDGSRLSKRHGSVSLAELREQGLPAERIVGWLAAASGLIEIATDASPRELVAVWRPERVKREAVRLNEDWLAALMPD
ncbi:tRNA glutamyl-Q(34) synthetase GluQRS [Cohnella zeiphila]|uniref:Glutamyl-Q tRNA(Asp) synthetase n=1 Tax=Cohnella zeiphila TaxID=2761120 RepID=A0A7X0SHV1_9BACL|nr:tRNA glutamyl-Q(34) synthetase GluQRS [Cohnella zeiphila]